MHEPDSFELRLSATFAQMIGGIFYSLVASGWSAFHATLGAARVAGRLPDPSSAAVSAWAHSAFAVVVVSLPEGDPFRAELERYVREVVPGRAVAVAASFASGGE
jgi:hypothetical protein